MTQTRPASFAPPFDRADAEAWRALAESALKGSDFDRALVRRTLDGLARGPLFTAADAPDPARRGAPGASPFGRGLSAARDPFLPWGVRQAFRLDEPRLNTAILEDLAGGVSEIALDCAHGDADALRRALDGVLLDLAPVHLENASPEHAEALLALMEGAGASRGGLGFEIARLEDAGALTRLSAAPEGVGLICVRAERLFEAGAGEALELAASLCEGAAAMTALIESGLTPDLAAARIEVVYGADADVHLTIAKLRAARALWAQMLDAYGCAPGALGQRQRAVTAARSLSRRDPYTNLVRTACAGLAAAAGGADAITVRPLTERLGGPSPFARRLARNLQVLLQEESHLGKVADPAGGAFLHETLAEELARSGWSAFQALEASGGWRGVLASGALREQAEADAARRIADLATGRADLIGVTAYPVLTPDAPEAGPGLAPVAPPEGVPAACALAEPFEQLADAAAALPDRPKVFLATLGGKAAFGARASFAANRLAVAGIEAIAPAEHAGVDACADAFAASGAHAAILCGTDDAYAEHAEALARALKDRGARAVWLAGRPSRDAAALKAAGVDHFSHLRSDKLEELARLLETLGAQLPEAAA